MKLGIGLGWHTLAFEELVDVVRLAERLGYAAIYVDGDVSQIASRGDGDVLDGWTVLTSLIARSEHIPVGSIRLPHHWNAARLAQAAATLERIAPGRLRFFIGTGGQPADRRFGLPFGSGAERVARLDETLDAVRALWRGESVTRQGRFVQLEDARIRPVPPDGGPAIEVAGQGRRLLRVVARHAQRWDINLPPVESRVARALADLEEACAAEGRDPASLERSQWIFTRVGRDPEDPALREEFLRFNPWFAGLPETELAQSIVAGPASDCRRRLAAIRESFGLTLPVIDLSGLPHDAARRSIEALSPTGVKSASH